MPAASTSDSRGGLARLALAWAAYGAAATVLDFAAWRTSGVLRIVLALPAVVLSVAFGWFSLFILGVGGMLGWAWLTARHRVMGAAVLGVLVAIAMVADFWLLGASPLLVVVTAGVFAVLVARLFLASYPSRPRRGPRD